MFFDSVACFFKHTTRATVILEWGNKRKGLKDEQNPHQFKFWNGWVSWEWHFWQSSSLIYCSEQDSHQHWKWSGTAGCCWAFRMSRDGKLSCISRQSVLGLCWPPGSVPPHIWPLNTPYQSLWPTWQQWKKLTTTVFLELPSSSYGISSGHSGAAALSGWASPALSASPVTSSAPSKGLPTFLVLSHFSASLLKCREQNQTFNINQGLEHFIQLSYWNSK